jgi:hypothetical protein
MDVPLLTRIMEVCRESIKSDAELHRLLTRIISASKNGTLTMDDYNQLMVVTASTRRVTINPYTVNRMKTLMEKLFSDALNPDLEAILAGGCAYLVDAKGADIMDIRSILRKMVKDIKMASQKLGVGEGVPDGNR